MTVPYIARLHPLGDAKALTPVRAFTVVESRGEGWVAEAIVDPPSTVTSSIEATFWNALSMGLKPGKSVVLRLITVGTDAPTIPGAQGQATPTEIVRTWPSIVMRTSTIRGRTPTVPAYAVRLCDPVTMLASEQIWGTFTEISPGRIVGGALTLSWGGDGVGTLTPVLPGMPSVVIKERLRTGIAQVPFAIAGGARLGQWLRRFLARLGARIELIGYTNEKVELTVTDSPPEGTVHKFTLDGSTEPSGTNVRIAHIGSFARPPIRGSVLDNPTTGDARPIGVNGGVDRVIEGAQINFTEAAFRAQFSWKTELLDMMTPSIVSAQPKIHPGARLRFGNQSFSGTKNWQAGDTVHWFADGIYRNLVQIHKDGMAWRPPIPEDAGGVVFSAVVDDGSSAAGSPVARDRLGRIPVRFSFLAAPTRSTASDPNADPGGGGTGSTTQTWAGPPVSLPIVELMGGGTHSFLRGHRQGDPCRVSVQSPIFAEIIGFSYREDQRVGAELVDATAGIVVRQDTEGWSGLIFRPNEDPGDEAPENDGSEAD